MNQNIDTKSFLDNPSLLTEAFRQVIKSLDSSSEDDDTQEREAQLREIAKTITRLEKAGVSVPDGLRAEKTRLVAELAVQSEGLVALNHLADEMEDILHDLKTRIRRDVEPANSKKPRRKRSQAPKTDNSVLREHILRALKKLGGSARVADVIEEIDGQLEGKLLPGDLEWRESTNEYAWQNNVKWERYRMTQDGLLRSDSPRGHWQLNKDHK